MLYTDDDLRAAAQAGVLDQASLDPLLAFLAARPQATASAPRFDLSHLLWYAGALIVIGAMGLFTTLAFDRMGSLALTATALIYGAAFAAGGHYLWHRRGQRTVGGLLIAVAVSMAPLAVFGIQDHYDLWGAYGDPGRYQGFFVWIKGSWLFMEMATILVAALALRFYPFPFVVSIAAVALWFMSMDVAAWVAGQAEPSFAMRRSVSIWFGLGVLALAWVIDLRHSRRGDFAFWLHLFGLMAFWGGITASESSSEIGKAVYCLLNVGLIFLAVFLGRRAYAAFGAIGVTIYLGHLAGKVFKDSLLFPFALSAIGVAIIAAGLLYHQRRAAIAARVAASLPHVLQQLRPAHAR